VSVAFEKPGAGPSGPKLNRSFERGLSAWEKDAFNETPLKVVAKRIFEKRTYSVTGLD